MGDGCLQMDCAGGVAPGASERVRVAQKTVGGRAHFWLVDGVSAISQQTLSYCQRHRRHLFTLP